MSTIATDAVTTATTTATTIHQLRLCYSDRTTASTRRLASRAKLSNHPISTDSGQADSGDKNTQLDKHTEDKSALFRQLSTTTKLIATFFFLKKTILSIK